MFVSAAVVLRGVAGEDCADIIILQVNDFARDDEPEHRR
jgi:hypothetical protein